MRQLLNTEAGRPRLLSGSRAELPEGSRCRERWATWFPTTRPTSSSSATSVKSLTELEELVRSKNLTFKENVSKVPREEEERLIVYRIPIRLRNHRP